MSDSLRDRTRASSRDLLGNAPDQFNPDLFLIYEKDGVLVIEPREGVSFGGLDTLTDDSMADTLHRHSELSASDGSPNAVVNVDSDGVLYVDAGPKGLDVLYSAEIGTHLTVGNDLDVAGAILQGGGLYAGIVEEGSHPTNGEWITFSNGFQICMGAPTLSSAINMAWGGTFISGAATWTFPAAFSGLIGLSGSSGPADVNAAWLMHSSVTGTSTGFYFVRGDADPTVRTRMARQIAIGWA